jgi:hypothetical protein
LQCGSLDILKQFVRQVRGSCTNGKFRTFPGEFGILPL